MIGRLGATGSEIFLIWLGQASSARDSARVVHDRKGISDGKWLGVKRQVTPSDALVPLVTDYHDRATVFFNLTW